VTVSRGAVASVGRVATVLVQRPHDFGHTRIDTGLPRSPTAAAPGDQPDQLAPGDQRSPAVPLAGVTTTPLLPGAQHAVGEVGAVATLRIRLPTARVGGELAIP